MGLTLRELGTELDAHIEAGNAVMIESHSGIGKSQKIGQAYDRFRKKHAEHGLRVGFGVIFAATQTPPDLIGFQFKGEKTFPGDLFPDGKPRTVTVTDPSVPLWMISTEGLPAYAYDKFFLLIDEYGQGEPDVKRAIAEIFLNGGTSPWYLPPGSVRIGCTNTGARYGVTKDFDFCISRRVHIEITGDADVWIEDFANKPYRHQGRQWQVMPVTKAWAKANPTVLFEPMPEKQGPWANPRSVTAADRYLQVKGWDQAANVDVSNRLVMEALAGYIGMPGTQSMLTHFQFKLALPSYETVVADPTGTDVPSKPDMKLLMAYELAGLAKPEDMAQLITYIQRLKAKDMETTFVTSLMARDYARFITNPVMMAWVNKNAALLQLIGSLAA
jgi:hypothetical protein